MKPTLFFFRFLKKLRRKNEENMKTVSEFARQHNVTNRAVYNWIEQGKIQAKKVEGKLRIFEENANEKVKFFEENVNSNENDKLAENLESEIDYLRKELTQAHETLAEANQTIADMQKRHDTIVMQLTKQLEQQTLMLEDMRHRSLWRKVKSALGFAS